MQIPSRIAPCLWFDSRSRPAKSARAMQAMLRMKKLDIAALQQAFNADPS